MIPRPKESASAKTKKAAKAVAALSYRGFKFIKKPTITPKILRVIKQQGGERKREKKKKAHRLRHGVVTLREIRCRSTPDGLLLPKLSFQILVNTIFNDSGTIIDDPRIHTSAVRALQVASESYLVNLFRLSYLCSNHAHRMTLFIKDMLLAQRIISEGH